MIRAAFLGSSVIAGSDLPDPALRFSTVASRILGWHEINLGLARTRVAGRDEEGRIVSAVSGITRTPDVIRAEPDVVIVLHGEEDFEGSILIGERRFGLGSDSVAGIPALTQNQRRSASGTVEGSLRPLAAPDWPVVDIQAPASTRLDAAPGSFAGDYDALVGELLTRFTPAQIYLLTPPYRSDADTPNAAGSTLADYADAIREIALDREVRLLDAYRKSTIQPSTCDRLTVDGRILNADGHQHLAAFLIEAMARFKS